MGLLEEWLCNFLVDAIFHNWMVCLDCGHDSRKNLMIHHMIGYHSRKNHHQPVSQLGRTQGLILAKLWVRLSNCLWGFWISRSCTFVRNIVPAYNHGLIGEAFYQRRTKSIQTIRISVPIPLDAVKEVILDRLWISEPWIIKFTASQRNRREKTTD